MARDPKDTVREALAYSRKVLDEERDSLIGSYTNLSGPDKGKVTDPDGKRWIAPFTKAIKKIDVALESLSGGGANG